MYRTLEASDIKKERYVKWCTAPPKRGATKKASKENNVPRSLQESRTTSETTKKTIPPKKEASQ